MEKLINKKIENETLPLTKKNIHNLLLNKLQSDLDESDSKTYFL